MTRMTPLRTVSTVALLCAACGGSSLDGPDFVGGGGDEPLEPESVLTYNLYLGTDITVPLRAATMDELATRVQAGQQQFEANDFHVRADAIADRIAREQPSLVGLQEVVRVYRQAEGDRLAGGMTPADQLVIDFEQVLLAALADRGLTYRTAVREQLSDVEVPSASGEDLRVIDQDVILVEDSVTVGTTEARRFTARVPIPMPDGKSTNEIVRGFVAAVVTLQGVPTLFVNAHLEVADFEPVQVAQAVELLAWLREHDEPVILVGDFNSRGDPQQGTATYDLIEEAGYTDAWKLRADSSEPGYTCCQNPDLMNTGSGLDRRYDFIWLLGTLPAATPDVHLVGADPSERTRTGLWPSDHAGVSATFSE